MLERNDVLMGPCHDARGTTRPVVQFIVAREQAILRTITNGG